MWQGWGSSSLGLSQTLLTTLKEKKNPLLEDFLFLITLNVLDMGMKMGTKAQI